MGCRVVVGLLVVCGLLATFFLALSLVGLLPTHDDPRHDAVLSSLVPFSEASLSFLSVEERAHMQDVARLLWGLAFVFLAVSFSFWFLDVGAREKRLAGHIIAWLGVVVSVLGAFSFGAFWRWVHVVFFPQGGWSFPADSVLISLYPESYFVFCAALFVGLVFLVSGAFLFAGAPRTRSSRSRVRPR